jgi:DNA repair protein RadD
MFTLRPYQEAAKQAVYDHLRNRDDNPCVVIPTAGGKTPVMASICKDTVTQWQGRVLVLAHVKELLEQSAEKLTAVCPELEFGIYSAGLGRRDIRAPVIIAGIQSVYRRACELDAFDLVLVDEAHMIPAEGDGMYRQFLAEAKTVCPHLRIVGFTATPFRMKTGPICTPDGFLNHTCYEVGVRELIVQGFLCPLITKAGVHKVDTSDVHVRGGEFVAGELEDLMDDDRLVESASGETVAYASDRKAVLIFATGIRHGEHIVRVLRDKHNIECGFVTGETPTAQRDAILNRFRRGELKYLCNVNVLTTGFDAPHIDCVALVRPTMSPGLYYQMVGRGFRLFPGKQNCLILDFGGNVLRHGPVDQINVVQRPRGDGEAPVKECPECNSLIAAGYATCPHCGYAFPPPVRQKHEPRAASVGILTGQATDTEYEVQDISYSVHKKRGADDDAPRSMRVDYRLGLNHWQSEFICVEHDGYARQKAISWWRQRSPDPVPDTAERAVEIAEAGGIALTEQITIRSVVGEKFDRIVRYRLGPKPEAIAVTPGYDEEDIPF